MFNRILLVLFFVAQLYFVGSIIWDQSIHTLLLVGFSVIFFVLSLAYRRDRLLHLKTSSKIKFDVFPMFLIGSFTTFYLQNHLGFNTVLSAGLVGFLGSFTSRLKIESAVNWPVAIYCGAFVGMTQLPLGYSYLFLATILAATFYTFSQHHFVGIGGKLGTLAFMGVLYSYIIFKIFF